MTRTLVFSDIHGNREAFSDLLAQTTQMQIDQYRCLGDVLGYYGHPVWVWQEALNRDPNLRLGNHEIYIGRAGIDAPDADRIFGTGRQALMGAIRHRGLLKKMRIWDTFYEKAIDDNRQSEYSEVFGSYRCIWVHADVTGADPLAKSGNGAYVKPILDINSAASTPYWHNIKQYLLAEHQANPIVTPVLWFGHTHIPTLAVISNQGVRFHGACYGQPISLAPLMAETGGVAVAINPGSVGQPRQGAASNSDTTRYAHTALFDSDAGTITFIAVPYQFKSKEVSHGLGQHRYLNMVGDDDLLILCRLLGKEGLWVTDKDLHAPTLPAELRGLSVEAANRLLRECAETGTLRPLAKPLLEYLWLLESNELIDSLKEPQRFANKNYVYTYDMSGFIVRE